MLGEAAEPSNVGTKFQFRFRKMLKEPEPSLTPFSKIQFLFHFRGLMFSFGTSPGAIVALELLDRRQLRSYSPIENARTQEADIEKIKTKNISCAGSASEGRYFGT